MLLITQFSTRIYLETIFWPYWKVVKSHRYWGSDEGGNVTLLFMKSVIPNTDDTGPNYVSH